jgi:hypothetical protein
VDLPPVSASIPGPVPRLQTICLSVICLSFLFVDLIEARQPGVVTCECQRRPLAVGRLVVARFLVQCFDSPRPFRYIAVHRSTVFTIYTQLFSSVPILALGSVLSFSHNFRFLPLGSVVRTSSTVLFSLTKHGVARSIVTCPRVRLELPAWIVQIEDESQPCKRCFYGLKPQRLNIPVSTVSRRRQHSRLGTKYLGVVRRGFRVTVKLLLWFPISFDLAGRSRILTYLERDCSARFASKFESII